MDFGIKFLTPLLIHGPESRDVDSVGLTGKALRGCWRFWFRALAGGMISGILPDKLNEYESQVFGSADENIGAKFRLLIEPKSALNPPIIVSPLSNQTIRFQGYEEGCEFVIKVMPRGNMPLPELNALIASIWLWGNLGGIGQRARRGFGSPVIIDGTDKPFGSLNLPVAELFANGPQLEDHLKDGLEKVWQAFATLLKIKINPIVTNAPSFVSPSNINYFFRLGSLDQVAVCPKIIIKATEDVLKDVHGKRTDTGELGRINPRLSSPVFLRLHRVGGGFNPIITWSCPDNSSSSQARDWLQKDLGFKRYLSGKLI